MRYDETQSEEFQNAPQWQEAESRFLLYELKETRRGGKGYELNPFSGGERNRLFLQRDGNFVDASLVSEIDFQQDGRGFAIFDFDRDGWLDLAIVSPQSPRLRIVKNQMGSAFASAVENADLSPPYIAAVRLTGNANSQQASPRDPYGAELLVVTNKSQQRLLFAAGEGLSSQNSDWLPITFPAGEIIESMEVRWPSGKTSQHEPPKNRQKLIIVEP